MPGYKHIVKVLVAAMILLVGIPATGKETVTGYILNIDNGKGLSSARIFLEFYRLKEEYENQNAGLCHNKHEPAAAVFRTQTSDEGGFAIDNVPLGQYLVVVHLRVRTPISICLTVIHMTGGRCQEDSRCNSMIVRYSGKRRFFKGDILMADPGAPWLPSGCEPNHFLDHQGVQATKVRFTYEDGRPVAGASIDAYYSRSELRPEDKIVSLKTNARGMADLAVIYSKASSTKESRTRLRDWGVDLSIEGLESADTMDSNKADFHVALRPGRTSRLPQIILFKLKCGDAALNTRWDAEVYK